MLARTVFDPTFDSLFDIFLGSFPAHTKPPIDKFIIYNEDGSPLSVEVQMALAGFKKDDVDVYSESGVLYIKGDNLKNKEVSERFKCKFSHKLPFPKRVNVDGAECSLEDGILTVKIPVQEEVKNRKNLLK